MIEYKHIRKRYWELPLVASLIFLMMVPISCKKYFDKKPSLNLTVPTTLNDLQSMLDNSFMNAGGPGGYHELLADNFYVTNGSWNSSVEIDERLSYIWDGNVRFLQSNSAIWARPYSIIYDVNVVLDLLPGIGFNESEQSSYNAIKGSALFYRSFQFYQLAQLFCRPWSASAATDPGIVLQLAPQIEAHYSRATVKQTYEQIIGDLKTAAQLLPVSALFTTRPSRIAAYGMLARVYLSMRDYVNANLYADSVLTAYNALLDYNTLTPAGNPVLPANFLSNPEVLYENTGAGSLITNPNAVIDSNLYQSYDDNDLRKMVFFGAYGSGTYYWKGSYLSTASFTAIFTGITTDEIYLVRAECQARADNKEEAMADLNTLLRKRWKTGTFTDLTATDDADALNKVLTERRKELLFRGLRWTDLRRFNLENANITLTRIINGTTYTLPPNDPRWVLLIPDDEINRSGIEQNTR